MLQTLYRNYYWIKKTIENKVIRINLQLRSSQLWKISRIISRGAGNVAAILFPRAKLRSALVMGAFRWWWWWYTVLLRARCVTVLYYLHEKISTSGKEHLGPLASANGSFVLLFRCVLSRKNHKNWGREEDGLIIFHSSFLLISFSNTFTLRIHFLKIKNSKFY